MRCADFLAASIKDRNDFYDNPAAWSAKRRGINDMIAETDPDDGEPATREPEVIGGYPVHPAASLFELLEGDDFESLCESIRKFGVKVPVVMHGDVLLDGRNRVRAVERLRNEGFAIDLPITRWKPQGDELPSEFVWEVNRERRHMTDDAITMVSCEMLHIQNAERSQEAKKATQFKAGKSGNPSGKKQAETKSSPPAQRPSSEKDARSTVGKIAADAGTSMHKARQAVAVHKAVESGELPPGAIQDVVKGKKKLRDVAPKPVGRTGPGDDTAQIEADARAEEDARKNNGKEAISPRDVKKFTDQIEAMQRWCDSKKIGDAGREHLKAAHAFFRGLLS